MTEKDKKQLIITAVLFVILILLIGRAVRKVRRAATPHVPPPKTFSTSVREGLLAETPASPAPPEEDLFTHMQKKAHETPLSRDPFFPVSAPVTPGQDITLQLIGIAWDDDHPTAIINNLIVEEGSYIGNYKVIRIEKTKVILESDTERKELNLYL